MFGSEEVLAELLPPGVTLPRVVGIVRNSVPDELIHETLETFSLPSLVAQLETMTVADFERARDACLVVADVVVMVWRAIVAPFPPSVIERLCRSATSTGATLRKLRLCH